MPPKSIRKCLDRILGSLSKENFDKFVHELVQRQQEPRVLRNKVEGERDWEVAEVMIQIFTENTAVDVAMELLKEIDLTSEAEELAGAAGPPEKHFVDKHRTALIQKLSLLDPILDVLMDEGVINSEMYSEIRLEKQTKQEKVRRLLDYLEGTGEEGKDVFLSALRDQQSFLVKSLEKN
ncbi:apoptosis-associated speck-like protein containing a CARD [Melanotaenia boesemani]|uniref:apoptosis-associated speck-like protein containing a CARD n=1 Tax=Melanotaenia boesemani TaxID=1250792 RepID=UPI001C03FB3F|nr:apoptosis-associated speck-like protein containing a CARD [Melanotaenia boesemani]